ncbi:PIN domain-containing protein [Streptomyces sp. Midd1]|uniref:PIN domain-containing protein n=1 Tax=Streptomyces sp. Midd3 TaxID=3161191 RepID=UPI0034DAFA2D
MVITDRGHRSANSPARPIEECHDRQMLVTPLPGTNREHLLETLRTLHNDAVNLRGGRADSAYQALLVYLNWSSKSVRMLRNQIRGTDIDRLILTRRHGVLLDGVGHLAGSDQQSLVNGLVALELDERIDELEQAIAEYEQVSKRWDGERRLLVPDTTVFIKLPTHIEATDFAALLGGGPEPVHVLVPMQVIDELDRLKESKDKHVRWRAGRSLAVLDNRIRASGELRPANTASETDDPPRGAVTVEVLFDPTGHVRLPDEDDEIIDRAIVAQSLAGKPVTLVTYDTGQSMRAWALDLPVQKLRTDAGTGEEPARG